MAMVHVVDDDLTLRVLLEKLLLSQNYEVQIHDSAESLLSAAREGARGVVLLDLHMPSGMSGLALLQDCAPDPVWMPIVVLTGHGNVDVAVAAMRAGADDMLEKPVNRDQLFSRLKPLMEKEEREFALRCERVEMQGCLADLTPRESEVMVLLFKGLTNKDIGMALGISPRTAEVHRSRVLNKTMSDGVTDLVRRLMRLCLAPE